MFLSAQLVLSTHIQGNLIKVVYLSFVKPLSAISEVKIKLSSMLRQKNYTILLYNDIL